MLDTLFYPETTDRNKGLYALSFLAKVDGARIKKRVLARAGDLLLDMTAMQQPNNRDPAIDVLKALSGEDHGSDTAAWRKWVGSAR